MENFNSFGLPEAILHKLEHLNFKTPTPIQQQAIPIALQGKDILASAQTGTGKTAAFGLPLIAKLINDPESTALVITPTRELAVQVMESLKSFLSRQTNIRSALLIGGEQIVRQFRQLKNNPRLIVGTPGRINDHLKRKSLNLSKTKFLVLDETDRMLDMGFSIQIEEILKFITSPHQTLLFSATLPNNIKKIAAKSKYLNQPEYITIGRTSSPSENVEQKAINLKDADKYSELATQLGSRDGSVIIFVKTKINADKLANKLRKDGQRADAIHGDLRHSRRERVIANFRSKKHRILVATDIAARGLDIPHIEHVINYDLPQNPEDYIHRIGRTGRAEAKGSSLCFVTPADKVKWRMIQRLIDPEAKNSAADSTPNKGKNYKGKNGKKPNFKKFKGGKAGKFGSKFGGKKTGFNKSRGNNKPVHNKAA